MITKEMKALGKIFDNNLCDLRIVGGAVRDHLLGETPSDMDFATDAEPDEMIKFLEAANWRVHLTGLAHGTITVLGPNKIPYEITTLRIDIETNGRQATVEFTTNFSLDAQRRDLTINAMSMDLDGNIFDYFGGRADLKNGVVRFVGDADRRIKEDYLRILRYFRFLGRFAPAKFLTSDQTPTLLTVQENAKGLNDISGERKWSEIKKIVTGPNASAIISLMINAGCWPEELGSTFTTGMDNPITAIAMGVKRPIRVNGLFHFSKKEFDLLKFLTANKLTRFTIEEAKRQIVLSNTITKEMMIELFKMQCKGTWALDFWEVPTFPVTGKDLLAEGVTAGPDMGKMLNTLKREWVSSDFAKSKEELLQWLKN